MYYNIVQIVLVLVTPAINTFNKAAHTAVKECTRASCVHLFICRAAKDMELLVLGLLVLSLCAVPICGKPLYNKYCVQ